MDELEDVKITKIIKAKSKKAIPIIGKIFTSNSLFSINKLMKF